MSASRCDGSYLDMAASNGNVTPKKNSDVFLFLVTQFGNDHGKDTNEATRNRDTADCCHQGCRMICGMFDDVAP